MLLALDVGNTNVVFALFDGDTVKAQWRMATRTDRTTDEYAATLYQLLNMHGLKPEEVRDAIMASVVPEIDRPLKGALKQLFDIAPMHVGADGVELGMIVRIDNPAEAGADRLVNAVAASHRYPGNLVVLDFGTATTFDVIEEGGIYAGGIIAPGINLSLQALEQATAKLPRIAVKKPEKVIGTDTVGAMQSGVFFGYLSMIDGMIERITTELGKPVTVIATGGLAPLFVGASPRINALDADLTIRGLYTIYQMNQEKGSGQAVPRKKQGNAA